MGVTVESNVDEVTAVYDELPFGEHELEVANIMEYAVYLHFSEGYFVFNPEMLARIVREKIESFAEDAGELSDAVIEGALQTAAAEYVNWLVDITGETQPPLRAGEPRRKARRGHWADITGQLAAGFRSRVDEGAVMDHSGAAPEPDEIIERLRLSYP